MKKTILFFTVMVMSIANFSCNNDDSTNLNENAQKLIGTWGTLGWDDEFYKKFTFRNDSKVEYYTYHSNENELEEIGTWSMDGDILTMVYPETITSTFVQKVIFISDSKVQFIQAEGSNEEPWEGTYYREE